MDGFPRIVLVVLGMLFILPASQCFSQGRLVVEGTAYIPIENQAKLVIENASSNAILSTGAGGILTESEYDQVVWKIGGASGNYQIPFVSEVTLTSIPFTTNITIPGTGNGTIWFSTYPGAIWDNDTYKPSDVTTMGSAGSANNSDHVVDRFWIVDALDYTVKPEVILGFTYRDSEHTQAGNLIMEPALGAQRFNPVSNTWGDYLPQGITNTAVNTTSLVPVSSADFWRSWTLVENNIPLAVQLAYLKTLCNGNQLTIYWQTLGETNTDYFDIERMNATTSQFELITSVNALGSGGTHTYSEALNVLEGDFRLVEVDVDGNRSILAYVSGNCRDGLETFATYDHTVGAILLQFTGEQESVENMLVYDASGRLVFEQQLAIQKGGNTYVIPNVRLSSGVYFVQWKNGTNLLNEPIIKAY